MLKSVYSNPTQDKRLNQSQQKLKSYVRVFIDKISFKEKKSSNQI